MNGFQKDRKRRAAGYALGGAWVLVCSGAIPADDTPLNTNRISSPLAGRVEIRLELLVDGSVSEKSETAVLAGLRWLARHQQPDGHWDSGGFANQCGRILPGTCHGPGYPEYATGVSGLALLAFLGAGYTQHSRDTYDGICFGQVVLKGLQWLIAHQDGGGCLGGRSAFKSMYNHAIATLALIEAYELTGADLYRKHAQESIHYLLAAQNPGRGWRYTARCGNNDASVTCWCLLALCRAAIAGLRVPPTAAAWGRAWLDEVTDEKFCVGYTRKGDRYPVVEGRSENYEHYESLTAFGITCRIFCGALNDLPVIRGGADLLLRNLPTWDNVHIDYYYWHHGSLALFLIDGPQGPHWTKWKEVVQNVLIPNQRKADDGCPGGSWDPIDRWGFEGGRVYATALNVLTLETPYRYPPSYRALLSPPPPFSRRPFTGKERRLAERLAESLDGEDEIERAVAMAGLRVLGRVIRPALLRACTRGTDRLKERAASLLQEFPEASRSDVFFARDVLRIRTAGEDTRFSLATGPPLDAGALREALGRLAQDWAAHGIDERILILDAPPGLPWGDVHALNDALVAAGITALDLSPSAWNPVRVAWGVAPIRHEAGIALLPFDYAQIRSIRRLIGDLDHDEYQVRARAQDQLEALGPPAAALVKKAAAAAPNTELGLRAARVLDAIHFPDARWTHYGMVPIAIGRKDGLTRVRVGERDEAALAHQEISGSTRSGHTVADHREDPLLVIATRIRNEFMELGLRRIQGVLRITPDVTLDAVAEVAFTLSRAGWRCHVDAGKP
jgi:hypothetical protein